MTSPHTELPIPDFDSAPLGSLSPRLRGLERIQIQLLLEHERAHAHRPAFIQHLEQRLADLDDGTDAASDAPRQHASAPAGVAQRPPTKSTQPRS